MIKKKIVIAQIYSSITQKNWLPISSHFWLPIMVIENGNRIFFNRLCWWPILSSNAWRNSGSNQTFFQLLD